MMKILMLAINPSEGYSVEEFDERGNRGHEIMTLQDLMDEVEDAIERHGAETKIITYDHQNRYGAAFGTIEEIITEVPEEEGWR